MYAHALNGVSGAPAGARIRVAWRFVTADPLAPLLDLAGVADDVAAAREAIDRALRHPALRRQGGQVAAEISLRSAVASAALEDAAYDLQDVRAGAVTDPVLQGALRVAGALTGMVDLWGGAPRQVLARVHVLAAHGLVPEPELGRPVDRPGAAERLDHLSALLTGGTSVSPIVLAAVVHGELLALRPFAGPNGVVARAAARLTLIARGVDPRGLVAVEVGHRERGPEYVGASGAFTTGTPDGLRSWMRHYAAAVRLGAEELTAVADKLAG